MKYKPLFGILLISTLLFFSCNRVEKKQKKVITQDMLLEMNRKMVITEAEIIDKFIIDNKLEMLVSKTGLRYSILNNTGDSINTGDIITLEYKTSLLDSTVCYSSEKNGLMNFTVGKGQVESGLEEAVMMMSKGAEALLIMPPYLAHGVAGDGNKIPKLAILIMDIKVIDVKKALATQVN